GVLWLGRHWPSCPSAKSGPAFARERVPPSQFKFLKFEKTKKSKIGKFQFEKIKQIAKIKTENSKFESIKARIETRGNPYSVSPSFGSLRFVTSTLIYFHGVLRLY